MGSRVLQTLSVGTVPTRQRRRGKSGVRHAGASSETAATGKMLSMQARLQENLSICNVAGRASAVTQSSRSIKRFGRYRSTGTPAPGLSRKETIMLAFLSAVSAFVADRFDKKNDRGATAVEYGLIVAGIAVGIVAIVFLLGDDITKMFTDVQTSINSR